ncbi:hypothetical protein LNO88_05740 [Klebsiella pneumoniae subsp. pneumoniae]|nr:hypothetical protein [Klebsiella pneumoniae subsp. pneumoniae]
MASRNDLASSAISLPPWSKRAGSAAGDSDGVTTQAWWRLRAPTVTTHLSSCRTHSKRKPYPHSCRTRYWDCLTDAAVSAPLDPCRHGIAVFSVVTRNFFFSTPA